jgi:hypothetical protein
VNGVTRFFLRAKHWQAFILIWGTYYLGQVAVVASLPTGHADPVKTALFTEAVILPFVVFLLGWLWSLGSFLSSISKPSLRLNVHLFRFAIGFVLLYFLAALPLFLSRNPKVGRVLLPVHLFALGCFIYIFYFVAKSLVLAERGKPITRNDYVLSLFLVLFSIIGIWWIQPRINRLYARTAG